MAQPKQELHEPTIPIDPTLVASAKPPLEPATPDKTRKDDIKALTDIRRAFAWPVHKWPMGRALVPEHRTVRRGRRGNAQVAKLHLPRSYRGQTGEDVRMVEAGDDMNKVVYEYYAEEVKKGSGDDNKKGGAKGLENYVHDDRVIARRHEFMGPDPRVAGYFYDGFGGVHIQWWDGFLKEQWMDGEKWTVQATLDDSGNWVDPDGC